MPSAPQAVVRKLPNTPTPIRAAGRPGQAPQVSHTRILLPACRAQVPPSDCSRQPALGVSLPPPISSRAQEKFGSSSRTQSPALSPHSPRGERSQSARRTREQPAGADGGASAELLAAALAVPVADQAGKWEAAAGMSPAGSPTQLRDAAQRRPQPARCCGRRQVPAWGWWEEQPRAWEGAAGRGAPRSPRLRPAPGG